MLANPSTYHLTLRLTLTSSLANVSHLANELQFVTYHTKWMMGIHTLIHPPHMLRLPLSPGCSANELIYYLNSVLRYVRCITCQ